MIFLGGIEVIRREVLISLTQLMEILEHVSVTLNSVREIKTETLRVSIMRTSKEKRNTGFVQHTFRRLCFLTSLLKVQTQSTRFLFFSFYFLNQIHFKSSTTATFPHIDGNGFESWHASIFFRLSFLSCISWSLTAIILFAFMIDLD